MGTDFIEYFLLERATSQQLRVLHRPYEQFIFIQGSQQQMWSINGRTANNDEGSSTTTSRIQTDVLMENSRISLSSSSHQLSLSRHEQYFLSPSISRRDSITDSPSLSSYHSYPSTIMTTSTTTTPTPSLVATNPSVADYDGDSSDDNYYFDEGMSLPSSSSYRENYRREDNHYYRNQSDEGVYYSDDDLLLEEEANELALWDGIFWLEACRSISRSVTFFHLSSLVEGVREEAYRAGMWFAAGSLHLPPPPPPPSEPPPPLSP